MEELARYSKKYITRCIMQYNTNYANRC